MSHDLFLLLLQAGDLPQPVTEHRFHPKRRWRFDYAWPAHMIAIEVEGGVWSRGRHTRGAGFVKDIEKYNEAAVLGWRVLRVTPQQLATDATINLLARVLPGGQNATESPHPGRISTIRNRE